ncbi:ParB/RepB/Spo0J family partition protein (plasmid) [Tundrisphaera lichenicola]|uniref:ParB/RepB/Spo0J family partition protein n=1 Tax=Tundrisphaera lichenicola TaxID=2029860 RepID=UPI003EB75B6E
MSKLEQLRRDAGANIGESMGGGRAAIGAIPRVSAGGPPPRPARLIGTTRSMNASEIEVDRIVPDPDQPREEFDPDALSRLAESLKTKGQLQPIRVWWNEERGHYVIIMGERRWRAAMSAGIATLSFVVAERPASVSELLGLQLVENCLREDLTDMEQAKAFKALMDTNGWSTHQLARELGVAQPNVVRAVALLKLSEPIQSRVESGELSASAAYAISGIVDVDEQSEVAARVISEGLSRDETVEVVRQAKARKSPAKGRGGRPRGSS